MVKEHDLYPFVPKQTLYNGVDLENFDLQVNIEITIKL